ncbi:MAG: hypothetical protein KDE58_37590 [Caldilineaceae bacterium]|nr:hypothetical protein [Caldilineaceae bacterium]
MPTLKEDCIYFVDGGYFQAKFNTDRQQMELWTYEGNSGRVIMRTGFEIDGQGQLHDRIFDFETQEQCILAWGSYRLEDLVEVGMEESLS